MIDAFDILYLAYRLRNDFSNEKLRLVKYCKTDLGKASHGLYSGFTQILHGFHTGFVWVFHR